MSLADLTGLICTVVNYDSCVDIDRVQSISFGNLSGLFVLGIKYLNENLQSDSQV